MIRKYLTLAVILGLVGASNTRPVQAQIVKGSSADLSTIAPDECGLFIWIGHSESFRFLAKNAGGIVLKDSGEVEALRPVSRTKIDKFDMAWHQTLRDRRGSEYVLRLENPLSAPDSITYRQGTFSFPSEDGWLRIESVVGLSTCNSSQIISNIAPVQNPNVFTLPEWLTKPEFQGTDIRAIETPSEVVISTPVNAPVIINENTSDVMAQSPSPYTQVEIFPAPITPPATTVAEPVIPQPVISEPVLIAASHNTVSAAPLPIQEPILSEPVQIPVQIEDTWVEPDPVLEVAVISEPTPAVSTAPATSLSPYEVQLGAYNDAVQGLEAWDQLTAQTPYLAKRPFRVATADSEAGETIYRLRVTGFKKLSGARRLCRRLKSDGVDCFPAKSN